MLQIALESFHRQYDLAYPTGLWPNSLLPRSLAQYCCAVHIRHAGEGRCRQASLNLTTSFRPHSIQGQTITADRRKTVPGDIILN
jgi:hypothetical protein